MYLNETSNEAWNISFPDTAVFTLFIVLVTSCEKLQSEDEFIPLRFAGCLL